MVKELVKMNFYTSNKIWVVCTLLYMTGLLEIGYENAEIEIRFIINAGVWIMMIYSNSNLNYKYLSPMPVSKKEVFKANLYTSLIIIAINMGLFIIAYVPILKDKEIFQFSIRLSFFVAYVIYLMYSETLGNIKYLLNVVGLIVLISLYGIQDIRFFIVTGVISVAWLIIFKFRIYKNVLGKLEKEVVCIN